MLRWVFIILGVPVFVVLGLAQSLQLHPTGGMPQGNIQISEAGGSPQANQDSTAASADAQAAVVAPIPTLAPTTSDDGGLNGLLAQMVAVARTWLGVPYAWGGCLRTGVDCSCFVQHVYAAFGINVPRTTVTQVAFDQPVPRDQMRVGDTVFFDNTCSDCGPNPTHEGLYLGNGLMIDAGDPVQIEPVYWSHFHSAGRPPGL